MRLGRTINVRMKVTSNESQIFNSLVLNKQQRPRTILGSNSPNRLLAGFLATSACRWLARRLTSLFLAHVRGLPGGSPDGSLIGLLPHSFRSSVARRTDRSLAYILVSSAHQWLARWLTRRITHWLTSSFLPLVSGLPGSPDGSLIGYLGRLSRAVFFTVHHDVHEA